MYYESVLYSTQGKIALSEFLLHFHFLFSDLEVPKKYFVVEVKTAIIAVAAVIVALPKVSVVAAAAVIVSTISTVNITCHTILNKTYLAFMHIDNASMSHAKISYLFHINRYIKYKGYHNILSLYLIWEKYVK